MPNAMGGPQTYFLNLVEALVKIDSANEYVVFLNAEAVKQFPITAPMLRVQACRVPGRVRPLRLLWENLILPGQARRARLDVVHSLGYIAPFALSGRSVVTVLDMIHYLHPHDVEPLKRLLWRVLFPLSLRRVDEIVSISRSVKKDIARFFPWAESKITPIPLGVNHALFNQAPSNKPVPFHTQNTQPFILSVASISPHKNIGTLFRAFARIRATAPDLQLVLVGMKTAASDDMLRLAHTLSIDRHVIFAGRILDRELVTLYQSARALVFPSLYEGFGLPLLEAMACGCPVIASDRSSIPEVVGNAALLFNPENIDQLIELILRVLFSEDTRSEFKQLGIEQAARFTWETTASQTLDLYRSC